MYWPLESCKESDVISSRNKGLHAHAHTNWLFGGDWQLRFRLFWLHWFTKIIIWLYFYASWWSYILEKCQVDLDCYFHYGGWVCFLFWIFRLADFFRNLKAHTFGHSSEVSLFFRINNNVGLFHFLEKENYPDFWNPRVSF